MMHQELVEKRRWISEHRFLHALNYTMVLPGPEAQQLATYIGWLMHGVWGGIAAGLCIGLAALSALGQGVVSASSIGASLKNSKATGKSLVLSVIPETYAIFGLLITILILLGLNII